jgi:Carboxypeptidase regulatory-like domain
MKRTFILFALLTICILTAAAAQPAVVVTGKVFWKSSGAPVPQALVEFAAGAQNARAVTLDDGSFYIPKLPAGSYAVTVRVRSQVFQFPNTQAGKDLALRL